MSVNFNAIMLQDVFLEILGLMIVNRGYEIKEVSWWIKISKKTQPWTRLGLF